MKKSPALVALMIICVVLITSLLVLGYYTFIMLPSATPRSTNVIEERGELLSYAYGDSLADLEIETHDGFTVTLKDTLEEKYAVVINVSDLCGSCTDLVRKLELFNDVFKHSDFRVILIWEDTIPKSVVGSSNIPLEDNYSLRGTIRLSATTPTIFILDKEKRIRYIDNSMNNVVQKLGQLNYIPQQVLRQNAIQRLSSMFQKDNSQGKLIYFSMTGCPDCKEADEFIDSSELINDAYDILRVYKYDEKDASKTIDHFGVYRTTFDISWYPSFVVLKSEPIFIGQLDSYQKLEDILSNH